ncbi:MAG: glycosyltransferase [Eubacterium sp.]|nr:glycosyltransferase [Eubacterium sp.]
MRICIVGPANSAHIVKWCNWFSTHGHEVHVISFIPGEIEGAHVHLIDVGVDAGGSDVGKLKYLLTGGQIKKLIREINPDVVNAHYATSYGVAMALSGVKGYALSVWGMDIYDFPKKSPLHRALLKFSLRRAGFLFSTSQAMADEASQYIKRKFIITPFGVDTRLFRPVDAAGSDDIFTVGTVKALSDKYGIRHILEAVAEIREEGEIPIRLRIAGKGPQEEEYHQLAKDLKIDDITTWLGFISQEEAAAEWAGMDIALVPSTLESESFGVSAVEAEACETPVIIADIPGLMEATSPGQTSLVVPRKDSKALAEAIRKLYADPELRKKLGKNGRQYVLEKYELKHCFRKIEKCLKKISKINGDIR